MMDERKSLLYALMDGDQQAFRSIIDLYGKDLYHLALGYVRLREVAEEIVEDVFIEVWNGRHCLDTVREFKSWLLVLVRNRAISYLRQCRHNDDISIEEIEEFHLPVIKSPDHDLISEEEICAINRAIASLPPKCKEFFLLAKIERIPYKEIAGMLGISVKTIDVHISRAIDRIALILNKSR